MSIEPAKLAGHRLESVTTEWHEFDGVRSEHPVHVWLRLEGLGTVQLQTLNGLQIRLREIGGPVDMGALGRLVVEPGGPQSISDKVGQRVDSIELIEVFSGGHSMGDVGAVLDFETGRVGVADLADTLVFEPWPGRWATWNVSIVDG